MQIICISRGTLIGGQKLAERLAEKLGYACLSREELIEAATKEGIPVGKLEMDMVKPGIFSERMAIERDHYLAFSTEYLCNKVVDGGLVYHGRTGHLLLPRVSHVMRVRVLAGEEYRIAGVMEKLRLTRDKAQRYIAEVDEDRRRWVHSMYGISWEDAANYDLVLSLDQMSLENAVAALVNISQLPDFQMTPASRKAMDNLRLAARVRIAIARDERTHRISVKTRADNGIVTVTYLPQEARFAETIPDVCKDIQGLKELRTTMAITNLLWIQEEFQPDSVLYNEVTGIATKWNAAVELIRLAPEDESDETDIQEEQPAGADSSLKQEYNGGIEDDLTHETEEKGGLQKTLAELARIGKSGGGQVVYGGQRQLLEMINRSIPYTLIVVGDVFKSMGHAAQLRATRDLRSFLSDHIKAPVVTADELETKYLFGKRDVMRFVGYSLITFVLFFLVFSYQEPILAFLAHSGWYSDAIKDTFLIKIEWLPKLIVSLAVFMFVPIVAYSYSSVTKTILKLIKME